MHDLFAMIRILAVGGRGVRIYSMMGGGGIGRGGMMGSRGMVGGGRMVRSRGGVGSGDNATVRVVLLGRGEVGVLVGILVEVVEGHRLSTVNLVYLYFR